MSFGQDIDALVDAIPTGSYEPDVYDFGQIIDEAASKPDPGVNRYMLMFTGQSLNGDGSLATDPMISDYISRLNQHGITLSVTPLTQLLR